MDETRDKFWWMNYLAVAPVAAGVVMIGWSREWGRWTTWANSGPLLVMAVLALQGIALLLLESRRDGGGSRRERVEMMRTAGLTTGYAVVLGLCMMMGVMAAGSMNILWISLGQGDSWRHWGIFDDPFNMLACVGYFAAGLVFRRGQAMGNPWAVVWGRRGMVWVICAMQTTLWLGAWYDPFGLVAFLERSSHQDGQVVNGNLALLANGVAAAVFVLKTLALMATGTAAWRKVTALMNGRAMEVAVKYLVPACMGNLLAGAAYLWLVEPVEDMQRAMRNVLTVVGVAGILCAAIAVSFACMRDRKATRG